MTVRTDTARPLRGKVVLVTRAREQAGRFAHLLQQAGAEVLAVPTITIKPPESWEPLDQALRDLQGYRWAVFTSVNGVRMVRERLSAAGRGSEALSGCRVAAIGPATAAALSQWGVRPEVVPAEYVAEALAAQLGTRVRRGDRVLLARAAGARDLLARELARRGAEVREVAAYRTDAAREGADGLASALAEGRIDVVTFTSASTVRHFAALLPTGALPRLMGGVVVACIGPVTEATAAQLGLDVRIVPSEYTIPALARAICDHYERTRS
jgi:uroporphyrinogen III methyltransferase / synthase